MLKLRIKIIEDILRATDSNLVASNLIQTIQEFSNNEFIPSDISQQVKLVKSDIVFQLKLRNCHREIRNLARALTIIQSDIY